jgi:PPP family 3-phenylpropionic acid transporter
MRSLKAQYFCGFAVMGSVVPYLPLFLAQRGLSPFLVGLVIASTGVAIMLTPVIITLLADTHFESRTLIGVTFLLGIAALLALWRSHTLPTLLLSYAFFALTFWPLLPLQDGLNFTMRRRQIDAGGTDVPYHHIRVWGTLGFILPSLLLWFFLRLDAPLGAVLWSGMAFCALGFVVTRFLPNVRQPAPQQAEAAQASADEAALSDTDEPASLDPPEKTSRLPTVEAIKRMVSKPQLLLFAVGMFLVHLVVAAYYTFYPIYLTTPELPAVNVGDEWVGLIANVGVVIEIFFMLAFGWFVRHWGLRWLMAIGTLAMGLRMALLFAMPTLSIAVGTQLLHGITVLVLHVAPPVFINHHAEPRFRNSMQGVYAMTVFGTGRIVGYIAAGLIAELSLLGVFAYGTGLCLVAAPLFYFAFRGEHTHPVQP